MPISHCYCLACVQQQNVAIAERCGNFSSVLSPGLSCVAWPLVGIAGTLSLRIQQLDVVCETKTKDNVFVQVAVSVQYRVLPEKVYDAFYRLTNPCDQIRSYVYDVVRSTVPRLELDATFESKADIADACQNQLKSVMSEYGYEILESLVTDLSPDNKVKTVMNEINASKRMRMANSFRAEADKLKQVKAAEAEAEARYLSGVGVARQRKAIVAGLQESINDFKTDVAGTSPKDVMDLLLLTQYFDLLRDVGANTVFLNHEPDAVAALQSQVRGGFMQGAAASSGGKSRF
jgi:regulator of protease activity HflC (stomatin/prohibitin superfamily)